MTIADEARDSAVPCEMVLYAYRKNKDGVVVSFVVHPNDMPDALATAHIGSRWYGALVQIGDDEKPIPLKPAKETPAKPSLAKDKPSEKAKRDWRDTDPTTQAGIRCNEAVFAAFLKEAWPGTWRDHPDAAEAVRSICGVPSRKLLNTVHEARVLWHQLDGQFQAWKALEHA